MYLFPDRLSRYQLRFDGDEERDKWSFAQVPESIITAVNAVAPLFTVSQQHCWCVDLERPVNLTNRMRRENLSAVQAASVYLCGHKHTAALSPGTENRWC